ncbi:hypothetical protein DFI_18425 (plasmid) [Deinococcus ficus]|uniref:Uncharacterized protein n=2 Tax=Deinococcus ficus TaxID=317577 RepID=A0A221T2M6_9DEIO|nr:hypothetical protein DFI_18425 [Deinococcus ficus]
MALSLILAACGQPATTPPAPSAESGVITENGESIQRRHIGDLAAASADCNIITNASAYCYNSAPGTQYRYVVRCNDDGIANRYSWDYGEWRNQSGTYRSHATCPAGDYFNTHYIDFR